MESTPTSNAPRAVLKRLAGALLGALVGGIALLIWFDHTDSYVVMTTAVVSLAAAVGIGIGFVLREHAG